MRRKLTWVVLFSAAIMVPAIFYEGKVSATPANSGFKATTIATGTFGEIDVFNQSSKNDLPAGFPGDVWLSLQKTKGPSDLYVQSNVWPAVNPTTGAVASTGWHTHPGHSLIIVTAGTITESMRPTAHPMCTHLSRDIRLPRSSIPVTATSTSSGTKARFRHQPSPSSSFRTIRPKRIAGSTLQPRRPAPTFCKEEGQIDGGGIDPWTRLRPTHPLIADTILDRNDNDQSVASGMVETWRRWLVTLPDEHSCFALGFFAPGSTAL